MGKLGKQPESSGLIREVARRFGVSPETVRAEMEAAIMEGFQRRAYDPAVRKAWAELCPDGARPDVGNVVFQLTYRARERLF